MADPAFKGAGRDVGLEIWRIEKLKVVPTERKSYGKFHTGDSYIVLQTKRQQYGYEWNIHFWLGSETSQDEAGIAAYKTVELDDSLGGAPVQHREVQNHESKKFTSLFPKGVQYLAGGVESGFKKVDRDKYDTRLLHVKGRRNIRVQQTKLAWSSMNSGDVFILDAGMKIWLWLGSKSGRVERIKGYEVARRIRDEERGGKADLIDFDEENMSDHDDFVKKLNAEGEGTPRDIQPPTDDATFERQSRDAVKLYRVSDASGELQLTEVGKYPLKVEMLDSKDAFIVDTGRGGIFAWLGKEATKQEKKAAFKNAVEFIQTKGYPSWTNVTCVREGAETPLFKQNFSNWLNKGETTTLVKTPTRTAAPKEKFKVSSMLQQGKREAQLLVDDGTGAVDIWRIEDFEMVPLDKGLYGQFFGGDSYVMLYTYLTNGKENYLIYFWLGQESSQDERGASALHARNLDDQYGGAPVQVRVVQNKEPDHFLLVFRGKMVVHSGGRASGFKNRADVDSYDVDGTRLFHVRGTDSINCRAVQVEEVAGSLNSNDCFILEIPACTYIWYGKGCSGDERQLADSIVTAVSPGREVIKLREGSEPEDFWAALGGKDEYASNKWLAQELPNYPPRLFQCSNASGKFNVEEIFDFAQDDLIEEDVMILDTYSEVYVWIGRGANEEEKRESLKIAQEYITSDPSGRDLDATLLLQVKQGFEPSTFRCHFLGWNPAVWTQDKSYEAYKQSVDSGITNVKDELKQYDDSRKLSYAQLKGSPVGIDLMKKEIYLTEEDFQEVFKVSVHQFKGLPKWKQNDLKKKVGLF